MPEFQPDPRKLNSNQAIDANNSDIQPFFNEVRPLEIAEDIFVNGRGIGAFSRYLIGLAAERVRAKRQTQNNPQE